MIKDGAINEELRAEIQKYTIKLIGQNEKLVLDSSTPNHIRFIPKVFDAIFGKKGKGWGANKRLLMFDFDNNEQSLNLNLFLGPGEQLIRTHIYTRTAGKKDLFNCRQKKLAPKWSNLSQTQLINYGTDPEIERAELFGIIKDKFEEFCKTDLLEIETFFSDNFFIDVEGSKVTKLNSIAPLNQILYGPPGTGKTYHTIEAAVKAAEPNFSPLVEGTNELRKAYNGVCQYSCNKLLLSSC